MWLNELGSCITLQLIQAYHQYGVGSSPALCITKRCPRLAAASDKAYRLFAYGRWFSPGSTAFSTTKTGRPDIAGILLRVALSTIYKSIKSIMCTVTTGKYSHYR